MRVYKTVTIFKALNFYYIQKKNARMPQVIYYIINILLKSFRALVGQHKKETFFLHQLCV